MVLRNVIKVNEEKPLFQMFFLKDDEDRSVEVKEGEEIDFREVERRLKQGESVFISCKRKQKLNTSLLAREDALISLEIKEILKENHYSDEAVAEILKWYVNKPEASDKEAGYRSWMGIIECVLEKMIGGSEKAHVMRQCNFTNNEFQIYLNFLLSGGFIREVKETAETTEKGLAFLKDYRRLNASLKL